MYGGRASFPLVVAPAWRRLGMATTLDGAAGYFGLFPGGVVAPSTPFDYVGLFNTALALPDPVPGHRAPG